MREVFTSAGRQDFRQRYEGTFGWYANDGKRLLVSVDRVLDGVMHFSDQNKVQYSANADKGVGFEFLPVERGLHNIDSDMVYMYRKVARQYKRGICPDNTVIRSFSTWDYIKIKHDVLEKLFTPVKVEEYINDWRNGKRVGVAFSQQFGVFKNNVVVYDNVIGKFDDETFKVNPLFKQEIQDIMKKYGLPYSVKGVKKNG